MMRDYELEDIGDRPQDNEERLEEIDRMPEEKVARLYASASVSKVKCDSCGETTWLIGAYGHNSNDSCHNCGETYKVVG